MDVKVFEYVVTLAKTKNYTRAARQLYMTPQGLSSAIKRLEGSLGVPLFDAKDDGVALTDYGRIFHRYAQTFVLDHVAMSNELNDLKRKRSGKILLAVTIGLMNSFPRSFAETFNSQSQTGAHVELSRTVFDVACESDLYDRACDFALMNDPIDHSSFSSLPLFRDTMFLCIPQGSPLREKSCLTRDDLRSLQIACLTPHEFKNVRELEQSLMRSAAGCTFLHGDEMIEVLELAASHEAHAITLRPHLGIFEREGFVCTPLTDVVWGFSLAWRSDRSLSPQDEEFLAFMKNCQEFHC